MRNPRMLTFGRDVRRRRPERPLGHEHCRLSGRDGKRCPCGAGIGEIQVDDVDSGGLDDALALAISEHVSARSDTNKAS